MTGLQGFCLGNAFGLLVGAVLMWRMNERWYRRAREVAEDITNNFTSVLRAAANHIPDKEISDALRAEADKADEVWR
ncbi:hypothetical protein [Kribbella sp. NPDC050470]|uniref:hypothetical protein n=1 Tax=unclassified Kribbella TaxID=2644121 RepID=UPI0037A4E302